MNKTIEACYCDSILPILFPFFMMINKVTILHL